MLQYVQIGPFLLQLPGLALLAGLWLGLTLAEKEAQKLKMDASVVYNLVLYGLIAGLVGARLIYAGRYAALYFEDPLGLIAVNSNTLSPVGGLGTGLVVAVWYGWRKRLSLRPTLDVLAPGLALFMVFFALAHFLSGNAFGAPTDLPWAINLWDESRHPSQVYEFLAALGVFLVAWKWPLARRGRGINFLVVIALSAAARLFLETFRGDSLLLAGELRAAQVISLAVLLGSMWLMRVWNPAQGDRKRIGARN